VVVTILDAQLNVTTVAAFESIGFAIFCIYVRYICFIDSALTVGWTEARSRTVRAQHAKAEKRDRTRTVHVLTA
jgi:hypothetical protein